MSRPLKLLSTLRQLNINCHLAAMIATTIKCWSRWLRLMPIGHGSAEVAKILAPQVASFGVCCLEEAQLLRDAGIK